MSAPHPTKCPQCSKNKLERYYGDGKGNASIPAVLYPGRPAHTYNDVKPFKTMSSNGGQKMIVDPSKHGDLGSWHTDVKPAPKPKKKK